MSQNGTIFCTSLNLRELEDLIGQMSLLFCNKNTFFVRRATSVTLAPHYCTCLVQDATSEDRGHHPVQIVLKS